MTIITHSNVMKYLATSPEDYIEQLPDDRKLPVSLLRETVRQHLPQGFEETINYDMIGYVVPHSAYPAGYHCDPKQPLPFINIASQKNYVALYHMGIYADEALLDWFAGEYPKYCKSKLDMGKSCIRFKKMGDIPYPLIAELVQKMSMEDWIQMYEKQFKR